jgi:GNAT superfamily N-acetyltransferase
MHRHLSEVLAIEKAAQQSLGSVYSDERWGAEEFLRDLPGKWTFSAAALLAGKVQGFWIASVKGDVVHSHRGCVSLVWRGRGVGRALVEFVREAARRDHKTMLTLSLPVTNESSIRLHERLGFSRARGDELRILLGANATKVAIGPDYYETAGGQRNHLYVHSLGERRQE